MEPVWSIGPILPPSLIDLLKKTDCEDEQDEEEPDEEIDYDDMLDDDYDNNSDDE